jgi:hypothetical protein
MTSSISINKLNNLRVVVRSAVSTITAIPAIPAISAIASVSAISAIVVTTMSISPVTFSQLSRFDFNGFSAVRSDDFAFISGTLFPLRECNCSVSGFRFSSGSRRSFVGRDRGTIAVVPAVVVPLR